MRHLVGFILAIALAAALFLAAGWGIAHLYLTVTPGRGLISITGLLAWTALLAVSPHRALGWVPLPGHAFGFGFRLLLASGALAALGAAMIVPLFMPSRWHGSHPKDDEDGADAALPAATGLVA